MTYFGIKYTALKYIFYKFQNAKINLLNKATEGKLSCVEGRVNCN